MNPSQDPNGTPGRHHLAVPYSDAVRFGAVCGVVVALVTFIVTAAWRSLAAVGFSLLYGVIAFVVVAGVASLLNWIVSRRKDDSRGEIDRPVLD